MAHTALPARISAGIPATNFALYWQIRFSVGDPTVLIELPTAEGGYRRVLILRDIEMQRARRQARVDTVYCPADLSPEVGLSGDRETATAQAAAELLRREGVKQVVGDRTLPLIYAWQMQQAGIEVICDPEWGVAGRRAKDEQEIQWLAEAQQATEGAVEMACRTVAHATSAADGTLLHDGSPLTSEHLRGMIDVWLLERGYLNPRAIVAGGPQGADPHEMGSGPLRTGEPVIIDVFPRNRQSLYNGDCTRTVVHGEISSELARMQEAVSAAKQAAIAATRAGVTGEAVHRAAIHSLQEHGYRAGRPDPQTPANEAVMLHGTGHGLGLDVHEPPLLDIGGPELVVGDALTIEPGLYRQDLGGLRIEDLVIVTASGTLNLNRLPEGLDWR